MNAVAQIRQTFRPFFTPMLTLMSGGSEEQRSKNQGWFRLILRSQRKGRTSLPFFLGLTPTDFYWMAVGRRYRIHDELLQGINSKDTQPVEDTRQQLLEMREDEWVEIRDLLVSHRAGLDNSEITMASIVAAACLGGSHLWRDLGMPDRASLKELLMGNFPSLVILNDRDMKWKKFFYKQLCELGGGYVCRAPSCDVCSAYSDCFGPED